MVIMTSLHWQQRLWGFQQAHKNWCLFYSRPLLIFHSFGATCPLVCYIYHAVTEPKYLLPWKFAKFMGSNGPIHDWPSFKVNPSAMYPGYFDHAQLICISNFAVWETNPLQTVTVNLLQRWWRTWTAAITSNWCKNRAHVQIDENGWHSLLCSLSHLGMISMALWQTSHTCKSWKMQSGVPEGVLISSNAMISLSLLCHTTTLV